LCVAALTLQGDTPAPVAAEASIIARNLIPAIPL
jgi:hypothetical protein